MEKNIPIESLLDLLSDKDKLTEAAEIIDLFWEDDYHSEAVERGDKDWSILDWAAEVVKKGLNESNRAKIEALIQG